MEGAIVITNVLDMHAEADRSSERVNQCLFGDALHAGKRRAGFVRVTKCVDGYSGWVDERLVTRVSSSDLSSYCAGQRWVVKSMQALLLSAIGGKLTQPPHFVYYGTRLNLRAAGKDYYRIVVPDLPRLFIKKRHLAPINSSKPLTGNQLVREARRFLGVPYLWGGLSPAGFDCSGLVQAVMSRFGRRVPRDTRDQISLGQNVARERTRTGDLVFFERHVGIAIGTTALIHASVGGGGVRINSLVAGQPDYREDLNRSYRMTRRVL